MHTCVGVVWATAVVVAELCVFAGIVLNFAWVSGNSAPPPRGPYAVGLALVVVSAAVTVVVVVLGVIHCKSVCKRGAMDSPTLLEDGAISL